MHLLKIFNKIEKIEPYSISWNNFKEPMKVFRIKYSRGWPGIKLGNALIQNTCYRPKKFLCSLLQVHDQRILLICIVRHQRSALHRLLTVNQFLELSSLSWIFMKFPVWNRMDIIVLHFLKKRTYQIG